MKTFIIDIARCNGCYGCQIACKDEYAGNDWPPYAKPQPDTGQFWIKLNEYVRGTAPKVKMYYQPVMCAHCDNAPCINVCSVKDAIYKRDDGLVIINPRKCTGCRNCVDICPYHAIYFNENLNIAQKCTGCVHLLDNGWKVPRCVDACATDCIKFGEESELQELINKGEIIPSKYETKPRLYYLNIPQKFVAGTVFDPAEKEIITGAVCTLTDKSNNDKFTATTDGFGDFWFENLKVSIFSLEIVKNRKRRIIEPINTVKDVNLGDIELS